jgi:hypothetical protein
MELLLDEHGTLAQRSHGRWFALHRKNARLAFSAGAGSAEIG